MLRLTILTLALTLACGRPAQDEALLTATRAYVARESEMKTINITSTRVDGDYARLFVEPVGINADPAIVFMKRVDGQWQGLSLGTGFPPDDLRAMGIPQSLWQD